MKILFFGDSLTKGQVGASFIDLLAERYPDGQLENGGTNGDTINMIAAKLQQHLAKANQYDYLILQGGINDILLPAFQARGGLFKFAYNAQLKKGLVPLTDPTQYYSALVQLFKACKAVFKGKIIFLTMTCLGEKLDTALNRQRAAYNQGARQAAAEEHIFLADAEPFFENYLATKAQADYLVESFWAVTFTDRIASIFKSGIRLLSKRRKLHLTIDGVHLNTMGAGLLSECISNTMEQ